MTTGESQDVKKSPNDLQHEQSAILTAKVYMAERKLELHKKWIETQENRQKKMKDRANDFYKLQKKCDELTKKNEKLNEDNKKAEKKCSEASKKARDLQADYYDRTKNIRVTDDDFSTIIAKLGKFSGKLSNFPPNSKPSFNKKLTVTQVKEYFISLHKEDGDEIEDLFTKAGKVDYALVSILIEKYIMKEIVKIVFKAAIHLDDEINKAYTEIQKLFIATKHDDWANELRLKTAKATFDKMHMQGYDKTNDDKTRNSLVDSISENLEGIYNNPKEIKSRIGKLVDMAIDLSLPIRGQEDLVEIIDLKKGNEVYTNQVKPQYRLPTEPGKIKIGISPVFLAKSTSDDEVADTYKKNYTLVYPGKAIY